MEVKKKRYGPFREKIGSVSKIKITQKYMII
jgi:hypothetical protein